MSFEVRNGRDAVLVTADAIGNHLVALARPQWHSGADQDPETPHGRTRPAGRAALRQDAEPPPSRAPLPGAEADRPLPHLANLGHPNMSAVMPVYQPSDSA